MSNSSDSSANYNLTQCVTTVEACSQATGISVADLLATTNYGYLPSAAMAGIFIAIYGISTVTHLYQSIRKRPRYMIVAAVCGLVELIGWGGRLWSRSVYYGGGYIMQICCLVIAPTFLSAALYMILGDMIPVIKPSASFISGKKFKIFFIIADVVTLVIQAIGGGLAATANTPDSEKSGSNIMLAGIVIQLIIMIVYVSYGAYWMLRSKHEINSYGGKVTQLILGMGIASLAIIVRGIYRSAELSENFNGSIAQNQGLFLLDAIPISTAMIALNIFHPSRLLQPLKEETLAYKGSLSKDTVVGEGLLMTNKASY